jgi:tRNA threonylcarbamoyladenosine modification (KEOPS) complex Cgi121 subunit
MYKIGNKSLYFHTIYLKKSYNFTLENFRKEFPSIFIQVVNFDIIYDYEHLYEILKISTFAKKRNIMCSNKLELDFLLRIVGTNQISKAILNGGLKIDNYAVFVILATTIQIKEIKKKLFDLFGDSKDQLYHDNEIEKRKLQKFKRISHDYTLNKNNCIKFLKEAGALVTI